MNDQKEKAEPTLGEVYKLAKENNHILKAMRRDAFVGGILKLVFWLALFVVLPYIIYSIYLAPYLTSLQSAYQDINTKADTLNNAAQDLEKLKAQFPNWQDLLNTIPGQ